MHVLHCFRVNLREARVHQMSLPTQVDVVSKYLGQRVGRCSCMSEPTECPVCPRPTVEGCVGCLLGLGFWPKD